MENSQYNAIICEGAAEQAIIQRLLEESILIVEKDEYLIENGPIRVRSASHFCDKYLGVILEGKVNVYRVLDSKKEKFSFKNKSQQGLYEEKLIIHDIITSPEIEMIIIFSEDRYVDFKKSNLKPSDYCKQELKFKKVKEYDFVYNYFKDINKLISAIKSYNSYMKKQKNFRLYDLLKDKYK